MTAETPTTKAQIAARFSDLTWFRFHMGQFMRTKVAQRLALRRWARMRVNMKRRVTDGR